MVKRLFSAVAFLIVYAATAMADDWMPVTDASTLQAGDQKVFAYKSESVTGDDISTSLMTTVTSTFSSDESTIISLGSGSSRSTIYTSNQKKVNINHGAMTQYYALTYQGYPYRRTSCEELLFAEGSTVTLSTGIPTQAGHAFEGWSFEGKIYQPGDSFVMPSDDVELVAVWKPTAIEDVTTINKAKKVFRDGELLIEEDGVLYNVQGAKIQ